MQAEGKRVVDYRSPDGEMVTQVRSTLLMSGLQVLREFGYYDRYVELLPAEHHERILYAVTPEWLPVELAVLHYRICDDLGIADAELDAIGQHVSKKIMGTFLGTLTRSSRAFGTSPWIPLGQYDRLWERILYGGGCRVEKAGPKDAVVSSFGIPMLESRYFRNGYLGMQRGAGLLFAKTVSVKRLPPPFGDPQSCATQISWV